MTQISKKEKLDCIGIDISKDKVDVCYTNNNKGRFLNIESGFKGLIKSLPSNKEVLVVLEPTGGYERKVIYALQAKGYNVALANTYKMRNYAKAMGILAKNDPIDSYVIKSFGEDMYPKGKLQILITKTEQFKKIENWLVRSRQLVKSITAEKNRLEKSISKEVVRSHVKMIKFMNKELARVEDKIQDLSSKEELLDKSVKIQKIEGLATVCANALTIYLPELGMVSNKRIAAIAGVAPFCKISGKYKGKSKISGGRGKLRSILYMGILSARTHNLVIKEYYERLQRKGKPHNLIMIACMRKLLCILNSMMRNGTEWDASYAK